MYCVTITIVKFLLSECVFSLQISVYNVISFKHFIFITISHKYFSSKYLEKVVRRLTSPPAQQAQNRPAPRRAK